MQKHKEGAYERFPTTRQKLKRSKGYCICSMFLQNTQTRHTLWQYVSLDSNTLLTTFTRQRGFQCSCPHHGSCYRTTHLAKVLSGFSKVFCVAAQGSGRWRWPARRLLHNYEQSRGHLSPAAGINFSASCFWHLLAMWHPLSPWTGRLIFLGRRSWRRNRSTQFFCTERIHPSAPHAGVPSERPAAQASRATQPHPILCTRTPRKHRENMHWRCTSDSMAIHWRFIGHIAWITLSNVLIRHGHVRKAPAKCKVQWCTV